MKVFVLTVGYYEDYSGGGDTVEGVFETREKALVKAREIAPKQVNKNPEANEWDIPVRGPYSSDMAITEWEIE